jgi:curved DNA-binding protein CbpA
MTGHRGGGRADYLGYYRALGLEQGVGVTLQLEDIKKAFRNAALRWHPDRHADEASKQKARDQFHLVRIAYDTLRDPERRRRYDMGDLRHHHHH